MGRNELSKGAGSSLVSTSNHSEKQAVGCSHSGPLSGSQELLLTQIKRKIATLGTAALRITPNLRAEDSLKTVLPQSRLSQSRILLRS